MTTKQKTLGQVAFEAYAKLINFPGTWDNACQESHEAWDLAAAAVVIEADKRRKQVTTTRFENAQKV